MDDECTCFKCEPGRFAVSIIFYLSVLMGAHPAPDASDETREAYRRTVACIEENAARGLLPEVVRHAA